MKVCVYFFESLFCVNISWVHTAAALTDGAGGGREGRGSECRARITANKSIKLHFISGKRTWLLNHFHSGSDKKRRRFPRRRSAGGPASTERSCSRV